MGYFEKTYHPPGTPPGTLVKPEGALPGEFTIHLIDYTTSEFEEKELTNPAECLPYLEKESITWIHLQGAIQADALKEIGAIFELHPLALEDVMNKGQRPKIDEYTDQLFVIMAMPTETEEAIGAEQVSLFLGHGYVISFHSGNVDPFDPLRHRLRNKGSRIRSEAADYLLYGIVDMVIDQGFPILEGFGESIETVEEELLSTTAKRTTLAEIHHLRRQLLLLRRKLWPQREVINSLLRDGNPLIRESTLPYLRDCYDHTIQILELLENYREMATGLIDIHLSSASNRLNEIMRVLTLIATIFIPLTFVVGVYGMNFSNPDSPWAMPELHWYYGYPMTWGIMIAMVIGMVIYFKRKEWL